MESKYLSILVCPNCAGKLEFCRIEKSINDRIMEGEIQCTSCSSCYPVRSSVPRFVPKHNYTESFGVQWKKHYQTQYDSYTKLPISETRFFDETKWPRSLEGKTILEAGCGGGRFTSHAASTGALVVSFDYSSAVEQNFAENGHLENVLILQADILHPPLQLAYFDKIFCFGVLQHTSIPRRSFLSLVRLLKLGGEVVVDVYKKNALGRFFSFTPAPPTKYYVRPLAKLLSNDTLYCCTRRYVDIFWPVSNLLTKIPVLGRKINWILLIPDHRDLGISETIAKEWAYLNIFDMLAPEYDNPQTLREVKSWFDFANLRNVRVVFGYNGIVGSGTLKADDGQIGHY